ncbi:MAG: oligosaccharide flippase family protein [Candidatus Omnitrophica bacterium]|nr:oligosaccharide flippase family protein [Candidatus Omnitrophota bacterium]
MRLDSFTKNSLIIFLASGIGNFINLLYQWFIVRLVTPETFASLSSLLSLLAIFILPFSAFATMVTKHVSCFNAQKDQDSLRSIWQVLARHAFFFSFIIFLPVVIFSSSISRFLYIESRASVIILGSIIFVSGIGSVISGGLQGLEKFKILAILSLIAGLLKLVSPFVLLKFFAQLEGALLGFLAPMIFGIIISIPLVWSLFKKAKPTRVNTRELYFYILPVFAASLIFLLLTNFDMVLVKHFFILQAQDYAVAQLFGKILLFLPGWIYLVMFARVSSLHAQKQSSKTVLKSTLLFSLLPGLLVTIIFNLFPELAFGILAHRHSPQIIILGRVFSFSMLIFAMVNTLFYYQLSVERFNFLLPSALITAFVFLLLWFWHISVLWVAGMLLVASVCILIINLRSAFNAVLI